MKGGMNTVFFTVYGEDSFIYLFLSVVSLIQEIVPI